MRLRKDIQNPKCLAYNTRLVLFEDKLATFKNIIIKTTIGTIVDKSLNKETV